MGICASEEIWTIEDHTFRRTETLSNRVKLWEGLHIYMSPSNFFLENGYCYLVFGTHNGFGLDHEEQIRIRVYTESGSKEHQITFKFKLGTDPKHRRVLVESAIREN
jgi:hypothetical protein